MSKAVESGTKFYIAMCQTYECAKDENGEHIIIETPNQWFREGIHQERYRTSKRCKMQKAEGKFRAFGANGKVVSSYDSAAKAARYCGKEGHVIELNSDDGLKVGVSIEEQMEHCEDRMLFWGQEADRLQAEMRKVNE